MGCAIFSLISRLHASSWSFIGWAGLFAGLWLIRPGKPQIPKIFAEILLADFFINVATPFIIGGVGILTLLFDKRSKGAPWSAWVLPLFGIIYFGTQAGFEEFMLRRMEKKKARSR